MSFNIPEPLKYVIHKASARPKLSAAWDDPAWAKAETLTVSHFRSEGSEHKPPTQARLLYDARGLYGIFHVDDQYVLCTHTAYQSDVYKDACVEFFVKPKPDKGHFNFEMNCGGALLASYIVDPRRINDPARPSVKFVKYTRLPDEVGALVKIHHTLPSVIDPEIEEPLAWELAFHIPFSLFEKYVGPLGDVAGQEWRANFNKCSEACSHPHWGTWAPLRGALNFHQPDYFAPICFAP